MSETMHPLMRRRLGQVERQRAATVAYDFRAALDELERQAVRVDQLIGSSLSGPIVETCTRFRSALDTGGARASISRIGDGATTTDRRRDLTPDVETA